VCHRPRANSGWKAVGETTQAAEGRVFGRGAFYGVTFNQRGSGPFHMGTAVCNYTLDLSGGVGPGRGTCAWTDADGDKIYTDYDGALTADGIFNGMNQYAGGTGKFGGITGKAPFQCKALSAQGHFALRRSGRQVQAWETFLNGDSTKERLASRYLYEHLFPAHLYFDADPQCQIAGVHRRVRALASEPDYRALADRFAIRRTHPAFWAHSDALQDASQRAAPGEAGLFDYNWLENR